MPLAIGTFLGAKSPAAADIAHGLLLLLHLKVIHALSQKVKLIQNSDKLATLCLELGHIFKTRFF